MPSSIDITKPIYGTPTTQSVRDNFHIARDEITDLQNVSTGFVNRSGDIMSGMLTLFGPPVNQNDAATLDWTLRQLHSSVNTLIFIGDYDGANNIILSSGQPQFVVGQPLPPASPVTSQYYFVVKSSHAPPGVGNQPAEGVTQGTFLISNGVGWINFAMTAAEVIAQTVPVSPAIPNVPGANVYDALASIGQNALFKTGGTLTGDLILNRNPVVPMGAATKQYVDVMILAGAGIGEAPNLPWSYARQLGNWTNTPTFSKLSLTNSANTQFVINSTDSFASQIIGTKLEVNRWALELGGTSTGANFNIFRYNDAGALLDGAPVLSIDRATGNTTLRHHLYIDPLISTEAHLYGRGPNNPTNALSDTLNIYSRNGIVSSVIGLRGPTYTPNPNGFEIYTGAANINWKFDQAGNLVTPGNIYIPESKAVVFSNDSTIVKSAGNWVFTGNPDWRFWFEAGTGIWRWEGYPNFALKMQIDGSGILWTLGQISVGGNGVAYRGFSNNAHAFGWNGNLNCYVNGTYIGDAALTSWVNTYFATYSWVNANFLLLSGGTITGGLTVNGNLYGANLYARGGSSAIASGGSGVLIQFNPGWYWDWAAASGTLIWMNGDYGIFWVNHANLSAYNNLGWTGGRGAYQDFSDERSKQNIRSTEIGLTEILQLKPISFNRMIPKKDVMVMSERNEIGFSANQVQQIIPEAVVPFGAMDSTGKDDLDSESPMLSYATTPIVAALVNAVKELKAEIELLKGRSS